MGRQFPTERDQKIVNLRNEGLTLSAIAEQFGVSRERIRQITSKAGALDRAGKKSRLHEQEIERNSSKREKILDLLQDEPGLDLQDVSDRLGMTQSELRKLAPSEIRRLTVSIGPTKEQITKWSDEQILEAIRTASTYEFPLTVAKYADLVARGEIFGPSAPLVYQRFGYWSAACQLAGVECGASLTESYESRWTDDDLLGFVISYLLDEESLGTFDGFMRWASKVNSECPSPATLRIRLGSWSEVKRRALTSSKFRQALCIRVSDRRRHDAL